MAKSSPLMVALCLLMATATWAESSALNIEKALKAQHQLASERPGDPMVHNDLGNLLSLMDRFDEAEVSYQRAKELSPGDPSVRFNLGLLYQQSGRLGEAEQEYKNLLEAQPDDAWAHYQLGSVVYAQGKRNAAKESYARSFALDPTLSFPRHNPHVIDNPLATEALLLSSRYLESSTARVPRQYAEASRIADLMLESEKPKAAAPSLNPNAEGEVSPTANGGENGSLRPTARFDDKSSSSRVLTNEDLENVGQSGQAGNRNSRRSNSRSRNDAASRFSAAGRNSIPSRGAQSRGLSEGNTPSAGNRGRQVQRGRVNGGLTVGQALEGRTEAPEPNRPTTRRRGSNSGNVDGSLPENQTRRYRPGRRSTASLRLQVLDEQAG